jgi:hypothetical protein
LRSSPSRSGSRTSTSDGVPAPLSHHATALGRIQPRQTSEYGLSSAVRRRSAAEGGRSASQTRA